MPSRLTVIDNQNSRNEQYLTEHRIKIGKHVFFENPCYFGDAVTVGDNVIFCGQARIGSYTVIEADARIGERCDIGEGSFIGNGVVILDDVSLPERTYAGSDRRIIERSEEFTAVFSSHGKVESFFGTDKILMYEPEIGQDYEVSISFREFVKKSKLRQRLRIRQEEHRNEFLQKISSLLGILKIIEKNKQT